MNHDLTGQVSALPQPKVFEDLGNRSQCVLVADDDPLLRSLLETSLRNEGYVVLSASNGHEVVQLAQQHLPQLVLVDLMMPQMDGYEAIRQMRNDTRISHIPMIVMTARMRPDDVVVGFETGADDYIVKPFVVSEVLARVRSHLRRAARRPLLNALSGLPGGALIAQELGQRFQSHRPLALLHADLDNFKTFNDTYGFSRGDRAIMLLSSILQAAVARYGKGQDFIGHVGGDDFVVLTTPECVDPICAEALAMFERQVSHFYQAEDWQRGYQTGVDRFGVLRRFRLLSLSIGGVSNRTTAYSDPEEMARAAAEMKHAAKAQGGCTFLVDQRAAARPSHTPFQMESAFPVVVASGDSAFRALMLNALQRAGYSTREASTAAQLHDMCRQLPPALIIADAQLGSAAQDACQRRSGPSTHALVLTYGDADAFAPAEHVRVLCMPLPLADVMALVDQLRVGAQQFG